MCLELLNRKVKLNDFINALRCIRDNSNMYISVYMLSGLPGSAEYDYELHRYVIQELFMHNYIDQIKHHIYVPYPTDYTNDAHPDVTLIHEDWSKYDRLSFPVYNLPNLSSVDIWEQYIDLEHFINEQWERSLNIEPYSSHNLYPDYNIACYLADNVKEKEEEGLALDIGQGRLILTNRSSGEPA